MNAFRGALLGLLALSWSAAAQPQPQPQPQPPSLSVTPAPLKSAELLRRGATLSMIRSYLELGHFYLTHNRPDRARQILTYGLLHDPANPDLLSEAAQAAVRLGQLDDALEFASEAIRQRSTSERAWALEEIRRLKVASVAAAAQTTSSSGTAAVTATAPPPKAETAGAPTPPTSPMPAGELATKVRALHLATGLESAIKGYNVGKKAKERMTSLDLEKLKTEHFLPESFEISSFKVSSVTTDGKVTLATYGTVPDLQTAVGDYEKGSAEVSKLLEAVALPEATYRLRELRQQFPKEPEVKERLLFTLREQKLWADALKLVEEDLTALPDSASLAYEHALLLLEAGKVEQAAAEAAKLSSRQGSGVHGILARELATLAQSGAPPDLEMDLQSLLSGAGLPVTTVTEPLTATASTTAPAAK